MQYQLTEARRDLLAKLGNTLWRACYGEPQFNKGTPISAASVKPVPGLRSGILSVNPGKDGERLYQTLNAQDGANVRGLFPDTWIDEKSDIEPFVYWSGKRIHIEATWPKELQTTSITLEDLQPIPAQGKLFTLGMDGRGGTVSISLNQQIAHHLLIGGITGSGKTVTLWTILRQIAKVRDAQFILVNGKGNKGLGFVNGLPGQVGPLATDINSALNALGWAYRSMMDRYYSEPAEHPPLYVILDDFDAFTMIDDTISMLLFQLVKMGREVGIFVIGAIQSPKQDMFGSNGKGIRAQFGVRVALKVTNMYESKAIIDDTMPRADRLSGSGDAYLCADTLNTRILVAYTSDVQARAIGGGQPQMQEWPVFDKESIANASKPGPDKWPFSIEESIVALATAQNGWGRDKINYALKEVTGKAMGANRIKDSLKPHGDTLLDIYNRAVDAANMGKDSGD